MYVAARPSRRSCLITIMLRVCQRQRRHLWESLREWLLVPPFTRAFLKSPSSRGLSAIAELLVSLQLSERCNKITVTTVDGQFSVILAYFILAQSGKILAQFLRNSFIILFYFYFILLQMDEPLITSEVLRKDVTTTTSSLSSFVPRRLFQAQTETQCPRRLFLIPHAHDSSANLWATVRPFVTSLATSTPVFATVCRQSICQLSLVHTVDKTDSFVSCRPSFQFATNSLFTPPTRTRQNSLVLSVLAVWTELAAKQYISDILDLPVGYVLIGN